MFTLTIKDHDIAREIKTGQRTKVFGQEVEVAEIICIVSQSDPQINSWVVSLREIYEPAKVAA